MKKILIALFIGFSAFVNAQNKISGKITDRDNNPIKGVNIFVSELHKSSETDENVSDIVKKLPGTELIDGKLTVEGDKVISIKLDGEEYFKSNRSKEYYFFNNNWICN